MPRAVKIYLWMFLMFTLAVVSYLWLTSSNTVPDRYVGSAADPATFMPDLQLKHSVIYSAIRNGMFFISYPWEWGIYILLLFGGAARRWQDRLNGTGWTVLLRFPLYVGIISLVSLLAFLPFRITGYLLSKGFGISTQSIWSWLQDMAVSFSINYLILVLASAVAFWLIGKGGLWWFKLWLLSVPFLVFLMYIQPVVIDPLYNQFTRLSDPQLEQHILALADKADIPAVRVYEVNMSEKTNALNAYVDGIGGSLRIVLWDTLLAKLSEQEIMLIVAHEMGHYVKHHLEWSALGAIGSTFLLLWAGNWLLRWMIRNWGREWGVRKPNDLVVLPIILLLLSVLSFASAPVSNLVSRQAERAADRYAFDLIGSTDGAASMYQKLGSNSLSEVNPALLVKLFRSSHPSLMERIIDAESYQPSGK